ncbi:MAG: hypothetical protein ACMXX5_01235 [Candidatus Woesearchaeota archaeon]
MKKLVLLIAFLFILLASGISFGYVFEPFPSNFITKYTIVHEVEPIAVDQMPKPEFSFIAADFPLTDIGTGKEVGIGLFPASEDYERWCGTSGRRPFLDKRIQFDCRQDKPLLGRLTWWNENK